MSQNVRLATTVDLDDLVELGRDSFDFGGLNKFYEYNTEKARDEFTKMIESADRLLIVLDTDSGVKGMFGAIAFEVLYGQGLGTFEQYIYIDEAHRSGYAMRKFMRGYETWGKALGAVMQFIVSHDEHNKLERFYSLFGYEPSDRVYIRKL